MRHNPLYILFKYRELLYILTWRHIKVRYKQSFLGIGWAIAQPIATMILFTIIFSVFLKVPSEGIPYPLFVYSALLPWTFFSTSLMQATNSLTSNTNLITKVYFPREIIIYSVILANSLDFIISAFVYAIMMFYYGVHINQVMLMLPLLIFIQVVLMTALSLFTASVNVKYRDIGYVLPFGVQLLMYLCPIIYSIDAVPPQYRFWYMINPVASLIDSYRRVLAKGALPDIYYLSLAFIATSIIFLLSYSYFKKAEVEFADVI